jgi:hypothetical protein
MAHRISGFAAALAMAALFAAGAVPGASARPLVPSERRYEPFDSVLPACADAAPLNEILARFHERETEFWRTGLEIVAFADVREIGFRSNGLDYIPRRYCQAHVQMSDAKLRSVSYSISKDFGGIGDQFGVEWCVNGLDRFDANAPNCKMARP